jgi:hypothetical protein
VKRVAAEIAATGAPAARPFDEDLPGYVLLMGCVWCWAGFPHGARGTVVCRGGQYYCVECARYFITNDVLQVHIRSKLHKNRVKVVAEEPYTHADAEAAAGMAPLVK